jgi:hypothetical protein
VTRLLAGLGIVTIGFASVAQAAGTDRKAYRAAREGRVTNAEIGHATPKQRATSDSLSRSQLFYVARLLTAAQYSLNYEKGILNAENRLIATQNRVIRQLDVATNPNVIRRLVAEGNSLQSSINHDLTLAENAENAVNLTLTDLQSYVAEGPGIAAAIARLDKIAAVDAAKIDAIAARPPFTYPPATPGS